MVSITGTGIAYLPVDPSGLLTEPFNERVAVGDLTPRLSQRLPYTKKYNHLLRSKGMRQLKKEVAQAHENRYQCRALRPLFKYQECNLFQANPKGLL
jgi:hypothetical protein